MREKRTASRVSAGPEDNLSRRAEWRERSGFSGSNQETVRGQGMATAERGNFTKWSRPQLLWAQLPADQV